MYICGLYRNSAWRGKPPNIICEDADLDHIVPLAAGACMGLAGQGCVNPTRLLVHASVHGEVVGRLEAFMPNLHVGGALDSETMIGPVISASACTRILDVIERARTEQVGRLIFGGRRSTLDEVGEAHLGGYFIKPALFVDVDPTSSLARDEIFEPVLSVMRFNGYEKAVAIANDSSYGLGAYVMSRHLERALMLAERI